MLAPCEVAPLELEASVASAARRSWCPAAPRTDLLCEVFETTNGDLHLHEEWQFAVVEERAWISDGAFRRRGINCQHIAIIHPFEVHAEVAIDGFDARWRVLHVSPALAENTFQNVLRSTGAYVPMFASSVVENAALAADLLNMIYESECGALSSAAFTERALEWLAALLRHNATVVAGVDTPRSGAASIQRVRAHLDTHFVDTPDIEELASIAQLSAAHLARSFARTVGLPVFAYLAERRLAHARRLLADGRAVSRVAYACGFSDHSHLSRRFRERFDVTPGAWQLSCRSASTHLAPAHLYTNALTT